MAVTRTSTGTYVSGTAGITAAFGTGAAAGNFAICIIETANQQPTVPTGWQTMNYNTQGTAAAAGGLLLYTIWKFITAADITSGVVIGDSGDHQSAVVLTFSGCDPTTPFVNTMTGSNAVATTSVGISNLQTSATITTADLGLAVIVTDRDSATASTNSGAAWANITGTNAFIVNASTSSGAGGGIIVNQLTPTANQTSDVPFSCTITSSAWYGEVYALKATSLKTLTVTGGYVAAGTAAGVIVAYLNNKTTSSTYSISDPSGCFTINTSTGVVSTTSTAVVAGTSYPVTITETQAGAVGSPKSTSLTFVGKPSYAVYWDYNTAGSSTDNQSTDGLGIVRANTSSVDEAIYANKSRTNGYFEALSVQWESNPGAHKIGFSNSNRPGPGYWLGQDSNSIGYAASGLVYYNGVSQTGTWASYQTATDVIGCYFNAGKVYFSKNGVWQNSADPVAGTGGIDVSATITTAYPAVSTGYIGGQFTANFGASAFTYSIPAGASAWQDSPPTGGGTRKPYSYAFILG